MFQRQDLLSVIAQIMKPSNDQIHIRVDMSKEDMDSFVFCIANRKTANKLSKEMADLVHVYHYSYNLLKKFFSFEKKKVSHKFFILF